MEGFGRADRSSAEAGTAELKKLSWMESCKGTWLQDIYNMVRRDIAKEWHIQAGEEALVLDGEH